MRVNKWIYRNETFQQPISLDKFKGLINSLEHLGRRGITWLVERTTVDWVCSIAILLILRVGEEAAWESARFLIIAQLGTGWQLSGLA